MERGFSETLDEPLADEESADSWASGRHSATACRENCGRLVWPETAESAFPLSDRELTLLPGQSRQADRTVALESCQTFADRDQRADWKLP